MARTAPTMLAIRLPSDIEERLAKATGRTKTYYAREAILDYRKRICAAFAIWAEGSKPGSRLSSGFELEPGKMPLRPAALTFPVYPPVAKQKRPQSLPRLELNRFQILPWWT